MVMEQTTEHNDDLNARHDGAAKEAEAGAGAGAEAGAGAGAGAEAGAGTGEGVGAGTRESVRAAGAGDEHAASVETPRSEGPTITVPPAQAHTSIWTHEFDAKTPTQEDGYFALQAPQSQPSEPSVSSLQAVVSPTSSTSSSPSPPSLSAQPRHSPPSPHAVHKTSSLGAMHRLANFVDAPDRPGVQRDLSQLSTLSNTSTASTATVTGYNSATTPTSATPNAPPASTTAPTLDIHQPPTTTLAPRPSYPNQAFSALQSQRYPPPHLPPTLRTNTFHPARPQTFRQAIASLHQSGSKTAGNSPTVTPGLFSPTPTIIENSNLGPDEQGFYASPFLHYTHRQAPKETHIADVDIDPVSGRKLINNYEIIDELGRGTHGKVKLGRNLQTNEYVAIKIVERYSKKRRLGKLGNAEDKVKKEVAILKKARHPNIVALLEVIDDPARKKVYIVLEHVQLGEIVWRAAAPREIALVESRRYDRESHNIFDEADEAEDRAILEEAKARRLKHQRRTMRKIRRQRLAVGDAPEAWSFEFGGDTDEDESDTEKASRVSTTTTTTTTTTDSSADKAEESNDEEHLSRPVSVSTERAGRSAITDADLQALNHTIFPSDVSLEGTMYGSYVDPSSAAPRAPSLASSVQSFDAYDFHHHVKVGQNTLAAELLDSDIHPDLLYVPCMTMQAARAAFRDTVLGLQYLHWQGIIHRDIKPPNLLQTSEHRTKISDFGVSYLGRPITDDQVAENLSESDAQDFDEAKELAKTVGTAAFYAPELCYTDLPIDGENPPPVGTAIDVWALGITLFCMLFGRTPFVDNEFVVMRRIADEEIYVPHKRLKPVDPRPKSRPNSHGRYFPNSAAGKRSEYEIAYEELDYSLLDLLHRLLIKDPEKRITLEEVRHHPWVLQDIPNKELWLNETDPSRQAQGKKIQVSKEELQDAVVPVKLVERIRSGLKKTVGGLMSGLGRASSTRQRAPSNAASNPPSGGSSSSTISQDARRASLRGDESIFSALKASRESEHPLAQSVTVSPAQTPHEVLFSNASTPTGGVGRRDLASQQHSEANTSRTSLTDRAKSIMSTTTSVRTIRASEAIPFPEAQSSPPSPSLTASSYESSTMSTIGGLLSGASRRIFKSVRDRSAAGRSTDSLDRFFSRATSEAGDAHANPSVAVTNTFAEGHMDLPDALKEIASASTSTFTSPATSRSQSAAGSDIEDGGRTTFVVKRQDSSNSLAARRRLEQQHSTSPFLKSPRMPNASLGHESGHAEAELMQRLIQEDRERTLSAANKNMDVRPMSLDTCPTSPDDDVGSMTRFESIRGEGKEHIPHRGTSPISHSSSLQPLMTPSSSEDRFGSGTPMTRSNPSIPSVTTVDSESTEEAGAPTSTSSKGVALSTTDALQLRAHQTILEDEGYAALDAHAIDDTDDDTDEDDDYDDEYEDSSDDDGGLQMVRRRSMPQVLRSSFGSSAGTAGHSSTLLLRHRQRRETGSSAFSKKSSRSGSNSTVMRLRSREDSDREEGARGRS